METKDKIRKDNAVSGNNTYLGNGQGCDTIWFKDVETACRALAQDGIKTGCDLVDYSQYPEFVCATAKKEYAKSFEYPNRIKKILEENIDDIGDDYYNIKLEELEHIARDGFIPFIDGGYHAYRVITLSTLQNYPSAFKGSKEKKAVNRRICEIIDSIYDSAYQDYPDKTDDEINDIALDQMSDDGVMFEFGVQFYYKGNRHSDIKTADSVYVYTVANFDSPYFRPQRGEMLLMKPVSMRINATTDNRIAKLAKKFNDMMSKIKD